MKNGGKIFSGLLFIAAAVLIVAHRANLLIFSELKLSSLILTAILAIVFIVSLVNLEYWGIFFSLAFVLIIYAKELNIEHLTPWTVLAAAMLLSIGFSIIFEKHNYKHETYKHIYTTADTDGVSNEERYTDSSNSEQYKHYHEHFSETVNVEDEDIVNFGVKMSGSIKYVNSKNLRAANLHCTCGALEVYFDNTVINPGGATISIYSSLSGVKLYIPRHWNTRNKIRCTLGGVDEKNGPSSNAGPLVTLEGYASLSGVEIVYI